MRSVMKTCKWCETKKPLFEFYKHAAMKDGHLNKCKSCIYAYASTPENRSKKSVRDRGYAKMPLYKALHQRAKTRWRQSEKGKLYEASARERSAANGKSRARRLANRRLDRQPCERCGTTVHVHAHHEDYSRPLDVMWLCPIHHKERHRELNEVH